jgi:hypothetical protein
MQTYGEMKVYVHALLIWALDECNCLAASPAALPPSKEAQTPCHGSDHLSPASHRGEPDSRQGQSKWDLRWTKWHWDRFFSEFFGLPCQYNSIVSLHIYISSGVLTVQRHSLTPSAWTWKLDLRGDLNVVAKTKILFCWKSRKLKI